MTYTQTRRTPITVARTAADATALFSAATLFSATPGRWFVSVDDASPYGWTAYAITLGGGNTLTFLADEPLLSGTTASEDTDPYLWIGYYNVSGTTGLASSITSQKRWTGAATNAAVSLLPLLNPGSGTQIVPGALGPTPVGAKEVPLLIAVGRPGTGTSAGWAGYTSRLRWSTVSGRANGDKLVDGSNNWIYASGAWVPMF